MAQSLLSHKKIFLTGATGFLGTALVEAILRTLPETELVVLIRPGRNVDVTTRLAKDVLANNCFDRLRQELNPEGFEHVTSTRLQAVAGDIGHDGLGLDKEGIDALASADIVIHSAATVSFDAMLDAATEINLLGPSRVLEAYQNARSGQDPGHFISVSTAYVAGSRKGDAPEASLLNQPHYPAISWKDEVVAARELRRSTERSSREPAQLSRLGAKAERELGAAGVALIAERVERLRSDWVRAQLVELGRSRAQSLGWPDAYAMTKALGERVLEERHGRTPLSIVRPSIIESSLHDPVPGWIRGFRMAEPIIISFARGLLKDFPGVPEGVIDVIPVDLVVGAILAVAASPRPESIQYYHAASGAVNPLRYRQLVSLVRTYFGEHPLYDDRGQAIKIPEWTYPGRGRVEASLRRTHKVITATNRITKSLPLRSSMLDYQDRLSETEQGLDRAISYVELYGAYAECEARYLVDNLLSLTEGLPTEPALPFAFDPRTIDWEDFVLGTHLPSVVEHARARTAPRLNRNRPSRDDRLRKSLMTGSRLVAFDLENTLIAANVVDSFSWLATASVTHGRRPRIVASLLAEAPRLLALDSRDRSDFLRYFYRRYRNADPATIERLSIDFLSGYLLRKSFPAGLARVRAHRAAGHMTVCITGALSIIVEPLRPLFDEMIALDMPIENGVLSGEVPGPLPIGEARADVLRTLAQTHGYSIADTIAYADSTSDLPMLELAGVAVAVNPDARLRQLAKRRGWLIEAWSRAAGFGEIYLPIGGEL
ncbi:MAG: HAD-IB family phosphatase [Ferrimicrobium sp.]